MIVGSRFCLTLALVWQCWPLTTRSDPLVVPFMPSHRPWALKRTKGFRNWLSHWKVEFCSLSCSFVQYYSHVTQAGQWRCRTHWCLRPILGSSSWPQNICKYCIHCFFLLISCHFQAFLEEVVDPSHDPHLLLESANVWVTAGGFSLYWWSSKASAVTVQQLPVISVAESSLSMLKAFCDFVSAFFVNLSSL